jgi:DNA-directed RNA polymerase specialized sigma24 family protein
MSSINFDSEWMSMQSEFAANIIDETFKQLHLSPDEKEQVQRELQTLVEEELPRLVKGLVMLSALGIKREHDSRRFQKKGIPLDQAEDLAQTVVSRIIEGFWTGWPSKNVGAYHSAIGYHVIADHGRQQKLQRRHFCQQRSIEAFPSKCDPILDRELLNQLLSQSGDLERIILRERLRGEEWPDIASKVGRSVSEIIKIAQRACSSGG